jgi:hypothetical protein
MLAQALRAGLGVGPGAAELVVDGAAQHHLAAMGHGRDPRRGVHHRPRVVHPARHRVAHQLGRPRVQAHPHPQALEHHLTLLPPVICIEHHPARARVAQQRLGPPDLEQRPLHVGAPGQRVGGPLEGHAEGALAAAAAAARSDGLVAAVPLERGPQDVVVQDRGVAHGLGVELPERGRAADVRAHNRNVAHRRRQRRQRRRRR